MAEEGCDAVDIRTKFGRGASCETGETAFVSDSVSSVLCNISPVSGFMELYAQLGACSILKYTFCTNNKNILEN